ncbi:ATP-binding protein [Pseudomonas syringae]|uniref:ATP-binding protein n=1 Tax=Pseudomonas syringae TaxID=317 RepID=UPI001BCB670B|nr:ATP-binding protein [Pseudomonas syringae]MBS7413624.1 ATP-binding protein [Pseudomonas syringae]MBS7422128.1 ATP-binding protein [Pseudomonas syringae]MBS7471453.1 ATP-binding protein [Pseudomonas syringae]QVI75016.1 ATP-binding protein [Pseudomonas syringae]
MADQVKAFPAKRFFVEMLTRDIELKDSLLDLLDNCIDGVMREKKGNLDEPQPYIGHEARITFNKDEFKITDNCGGIPRGVALERAFRLGRPDRETDKDIPTVGVYGIGMKRAIFKMGREAEINSFTEEGSYKVRISPEWIDDDATWTLPIEEVNRSSEETGVHVSITNLYPGISRLFSDATAFENDLIKSISAYYGNIILKGFDVYVNNHKIIPTGSSFILSQDSFNSGQGIVPYVYTGELDGVNIELVVGFYRNLPTDEEQEESLAGRPSTEQAGWTIICNDRVVLYADKTKVTGWGEAGVPQYHTQFVSIAGVVNFKSNDAARLPVTTTKRGIDGNSEIYLSIKEFMREGMKLFTSYTNKWKVPTIHRPELAVAAVASTTKSIAAMIPKEKWSQDRKSAIKGNKFKPILPIPEKSIDYRFLRFSRPISDIRTLGEHFFDDPDYAPGEIGGLCFDEALRRIKE